MLTFPSNLRTIIHLDLDSFFVSVERLLNNKLKGVPVIIGGNSDRGVVAACSYEARAFGVHSAMPMRQARILCPTAIFVRGDYDRYSQYSSMVTQLIAEKAPLFEKASIDEHYIDITGMDRFFGALKWTQELRKKIIAETGLPISFGLSVNKTVSKIATDESKPNGELEVPPPMIKPFLNPLSIKKIPMVGPKTYQLLTSMGIVKIETLSQMPPQMLQRVLGENGITLWQRANGIDNTPVEPYTERKSISSETTFETDTTNLQTLNNTLVKMVEELCYTLRKEGKVTACITVKIRYSNFDTHTKQKRLPYTSADHIILPIVKQLFNNLFERRLLIRLVGVKFSSLASGCQQIDLFNDSIEMINLYQALDKIKNRYGIKSIRKAVD